MINLDSILNLKNLSLPAKPVVEAIEYREIIDSIGEQALELVLILAESTTGEERHWRNIQPIVDEISNALLKSGDQRFPYLRAIKRSELQQLAEVGSAYWRCNMIFASSRFI